MLVIPYLMSPTGDPIVLGRVALHRLRHVWGRLSRRLQAERASRRLQAAQNSAYAHAVAAEGRAGRGDAVDLADLRFQIALACLLML